MMKNYARIEGGLVAELFSTDGDITQMFHPDLVWVEIPDTIHPAAGWSYGAEVFSAPPPPTTEQLGIWALEQRRGLMIWATQQMGPLQDAVDLDEATPDEVASLKTWKQYRVSLNRIELQEGWPQEIQWPVAPVFGG
jgi:hypothetical protein